MSLVLNVEILGEYKNLANATKGAASTMDGLKGTFDKVGTAISKTLSGIGIGFAVAVASQVKPAIDAASDLGEAVNAINVSFGDSADGILKLGETAATSLGLAKVELYGIATQFSSFAYQIAGEGGDVVQVIEDISTRGADFASVFNIEVSEALAKFQSGLAGQSEPLRAYGIDLSAAAVEAYALANGITDGEQAMTEQEKVLARYGLLMEQTSKVQGDFANTSDSLANTQRIMNAEFENLRAEVGEALLPVMVELFGAVRDSIPDLKELLGEVMKLVPVFVDLAKWIIDNRVAVVAFTAAAVALNAVILVGKAGLTAYNVVSAIFKTNTISNTAAIGAQTVAMNANAVSTTGATAAATGFVTQMGALALAAAPWVAAIGFIAAAFSNLRTNAAEAAAAVRELNAAKAAQTSTGGYSLSPGNQEYAPYSYNTPMSSGTTSPGIAGQNNINININRASLNAEQVIDEINGRLSSTGSNVRIQ